MSGTDCPSNVSVFGNLSALRVRPLGFGRIGDVAFAKVDLSSAPKMQLILQSSKNYGEMLRTLI